MNGPPFQLYEYESYLFVAAVWLAFIIFESRFDRWAVLGWSGAASSAHFRPILGGPGGVRAGIQNIYIYIYIYIQ